MKVLIHAFPPSLFRSTRAGFPTLFSAGVLLQSITTARAQNPYFWDNNVSTAGIGTAGGTWAEPTTNDPKQGWNTASARTNAMSGTTATPTSDASTFGTSSAQLGTGKAPRSERGGARSFWQKDIPATR